MQVSIHFPDSLAVMVREEKRKTGVPVSEMVRRGLELYLRNSYTPDSFSPRENNNTVSQSPLNARVAFEEQGEKCRSLRVDMMTAEQDCTDSPHDDTLRLKFESVSREYEIENEAYATLQAAYIASDQSK